MLWVSSIIATVKKPHLRFFNILFKLTKLTLLPNQKCMQKSLFVLITVLLVGVQETNGLQQSEPRKPNVIVILTDDQGYADVGFHGISDIRTPNIDRIAQRGIIFTQGYVTHPVCGPSRAAILTGRHQDRYGAGRNPLFAPNDSTMGLPLSEQNMAEALSEANYRSSFMGKWHLGAHWKMYPLQQGFDEFFGFLSGGHRYFPEEWLLNDNSEADNQWDGYRTRLMRNNGWIDEDEYVTDALSREGVDFIDRQSAENPFFLFMSYNAPHTPLQATQKYLDRFPDITDNTRKTYAAMMSAVDDGVGAILDKLEVKGLAENTIIFFLTDNGGLVIMAQITPHYEVQNLASLKVVYVCLLRFLGRQYYLPELPTINR